MNNSNKTLLQILVEELPKRGGWPKGAVKIHQDHDGETWVWLNHDSTERLFTLDQVATNARQFGEDETHQNMVTRDQYEAALAASKELRHYQVSTEHYTPDVSAGKTANATGANGWIDWHGGECPVDSDTIVEVKYRKPNPYQLNNDRAGDFTWSHDGSGDDIIAYLLPHPHEVKTAGIDVQRDEVKSNDAQLESDLNDCIGQPQEDIKTIRAEMLAVLNDTRLTMNLRAAMKLVDAFIDAGYRKQ